MWSHEYQESSGISLAQQLHEFADRTQEEKGHSQWLVDPEADFMAFVRTNERPIYPSPDFVYYSNGEISPIMLPTPCLDIVAFERRSATTEISMEDFYNFMSTLYRLGRWQAFCCDYVADPRVGEWCLENGWTHVERKGSDDPRGPYLDQYYVYLPYLPEHMVYGVVELRGGAHETRDERIGGYVLGIDPPKEIEP